MSVQRGLATDKTTTVGTKKLRIYDTKDDRREVYTMLKRLPPLWRVEWLERSCKLAFIPKARNRPHVSKKTHLRAQLAQQDDSLDEGLTTELFFDFWTMAANYGLDVDKSLEMLVGMVKAYSAR